VVRFPTRSALSVLRLRHLDAGIGKSRQLQPVHVIERRLAGLGRVKKVAQPARLGQGRTEWEMRAHASPFCARSVSCSPPDFAARTLAVHVKPIGYAHSSAAALTSRISKGRLSIGAPSLPVCSFTVVSFQPMRVFDHQIPQLGTALVQSPPPVAC
jgi:hypothetical protein